MILARLMACCVVGAGVLLPVSPAVAGTCADGDTDQPSVKLGPLTVERCFQPYTSDERATFKDVSSYYGRVEMDVTSGVSMELDKSFGNALAKFFGIKDSFTAVITVSVYAKIADEEVLVYEKPVYTVSRDEKGRTNLSATIIGGTGMTASPTFALNGANTEVRTRLKVALVNSRKLDMLPTIKDGVDLAVKMGGPTSLVTAVGEPAFLAVASRVQTTYESLLSDEETGDLDTILKFDPATGVKRVQYKVSFPLPKGQASSVDVKIGLATSESLITSDRRAGNDNVQWPKVSQLAGSRFADRVKLSTRVGAGLTPALLSTVLDQQGVPQKLEELAVPVGASEQLARQEAVNKSCLALQSALQKGPYRLSDSDAQLILFNELDRGGVFKRYDASQLSCTQDLVPIWKARYDLSAVTPVKPREISWKAKNNRLDRMAASWGMASTDVRQFALGDDFVPGSIRMVAPAGFIPGVPVDPDPQGNQTFTVSVKFLADRKKTCFGNFKPTSDSEPWATAFVQFDQDATLYLMTLRFDNRNDFLLSPGPRVEALEVRAASAADRRDFNQSGSCL